MTIREAARRLGLAHSTISRQLKQGKIRRRPDGRVSLAEVERDRSRNLSHMHRGAPANSECIPNFDDDRDEAWREHFCMFATQHGPLIAAKFGVDADEMCRVLFRHTLSHMCALLPGGYRDPQAAEPWQEGE
jgi:excisionase family DNA binding protein